jgi:hypothetical protein
MECYRHEGRVAVGCCRSCLKGVCRECAHDVGGGLACRGECEEAARGVIAMVSQGVDQRGVQLGMVKSARGLWSGLAFVALLVGAGVAVWGFTLPYFREISLLGVPFLILGLLMLRAVRTVRRAEAP